MISIVDCTPSDIPTIQRIAHETWWPTYSPILEPAQIEFMLNAIYSTNALQKVMYNGSQTFLLLADDEGPQGFAAYGTKNHAPEVCKLYKIYVLPKNHGKGYGKMLIDEIKRRLAAGKVAALDLNVNRYNPARKFYEKLGFIVIGEEDVPIGPYWMNDYVMRLTLAAQPPGWPIAR